MTDSTPRRCPAPNCREAPNWIRENSYYRTACSCGWRSPSFRSTMDALDAFDRHIRQENIAEVIRPSHRVIANLPERLRAFALSLQTDDPRIVTLDLAADELDHWREFEAAKVLYGQS